MQAASTEEFGASLPVEIGQRVRGAFYENAINVMNV